MASTVPLVPDCELRDDEETFRFKMDEFERLVRSSSRMVAFTGAGLSTSSGIPDFRGPEGVWTLLAQGRVGKEAPETATVLPTMGHMALVELLRHGPLVHIISQNGDGLHRRSGVHAAELSELHGNGSIEVCEDCGWTYFRDYRTSRKGPFGCRDHFTGRHCELPDCSGRLLELSIDFGQELPEESLRAAVAHSKAADLHVVLGSSLRVNPAAELPLATQQKGGKFVIVNLQRTPLTDRADLHIHADCDTVLLDLLKRLGISITPWRLRRRLSVGVELCDDAQTHQACRVTLQALHPEVSQRPSGSDRPHAYQPDELFASLFRSVKWTVPQGWQAVPDNATSLPGQCSAIIRSTTALHDDGDDSVFDILSNGGASVELQFQGHYHEPNLTVPLSILGHQYQPNEQRLVELAFDPHTRQWDVSLQFSEESSRIDRARSLNKQLGLEPAQRMPSYGTAHRRFLLQGRESETVLAAPVSASTGLHGAIATLLDPSMEGFQANPRGHCDHLPLNFSAFTAVFEGLASFSDLNLSCTLQSPDVPCASGRAICLECGHVFCIESHSQLSDGIFHSRHQKGHAIHHASQSRHATQVGLEDLSFWCHSCSDYLNNYQIRPLRDPYKVLHIAKFAEPPPR